MPTYLITKKATDVLDTPVFSAGPDGDQEAVAIFTRLENAEKYLAAAGWKDHQVAEVADRDFLRWVVKVYEGATDYLTIDPIRESQLAGEEQSTIEIASELDDLAERLMHSIVEQSVKRFSSKYEAGGPGIHG
jgi:hypothetical protein